MTTSPALRRDLALAMSEGELQQNVIDMAHAFGWLVSHARPARTAKGWRTATQGDVGAPDLLLARSGVVLHIELKTERGKLSVGQREWAAEMEWSYIVWLPSDWLSGRIEEALR